MTIPKDFKLSQLVPTVRKRLLDDPVFYSSDIFCIYPRDVAGYKTFLSITGEGERSTEEVHTFEDVVDYIDRYFLIIGTIDVDELKRKLHLLDYIDVGERKKSEFYRNNPLRITSYVVDEIDRCGGQVEQSTFYLGENQGLEACIQFNTPLTLNKKSIMIDGVAYQNVIRSRIAPYIRLKTNMEADLHELSNGKPVHPVLYAALNYVREYGQLPVKIGKDQTAENRMWSMIVSAYEVSKNNKDLVYFEGALFDKRDLWKAYHETYAVKILNFIMRA